MACIGWFVKTGPVPNPEVRPRTVAKMPFADGVSDAAWRRGVPGFILQGPLDNI